MDGFMAGAIAIEKSAWGPARRGSRWRLSSRL